MKGVNKKVWRCLSRVEQGKKYCNKSITLKEEERQDLKNKNVQIHPVKRNFYLPNIDSNISLESTGKDKERDETLKQK